MPMQNPFNAIGNFFKSAYNDILAGGAEWQLQRAISERDRAARDFKALNDVEMRKFDSVNQSKSPFDIAMEKYAHRIKTKQAQNPATDYEKVTATLNSRSETVKMLSEKIAGLRGDKDQSNVSAKNYEGRGLLAALGRRYFGRSSDGDRARDASVYDNLVGEEGIGQEEKRFWKLKQKEGQIRKDILSVDATLRLGDTGVRAE